MILAKSAIIKAINSKSLIIESVIGFQPEVQISANSIDMTLGRYLYKIEKEGNRVNLKTGEFDIDPILIDLSNFKYGFELRSDCCYLAVTNEWIGSDNLLPECADKSSMGRMFCPTHFNAGFFDLGFYGHTTLEIAPEINAMCYQNQMICQMKFTATSGSGNYKESGRYSNPFTGEDPKPILSKGVKILKNATAE